MNSKSNNNESVNVLEMNASILNAVSNLYLGSFAHIEYNADEKLPKTLGLGNVTKHVSGNVKVNYSYESARNRQLRRQGKKADFKSQPLKWGKWFITNKVIEHNGTLYFRFYTHKATRMHTTYFVNGRPATMQETALIRAYKANKAHDESNVRCVKFSGITELHSGKCHYSTETRTAVATAK